MHVDAVADDREQERAARRTTRVVEDLVADHEERVRPLHDLELVAFDAGERLERRSRRGAAARAVAVPRVQELVRHPVPDGATPTASAQHGPESITQTARREVIAGRAWRGHRRRDPGASCRGRAQPTAASSSTCSGSVAPNGDAAVVGVNGASAAGRSLRLSRLRRACGGG